MTTNPTPQPTANPFPKAALDAIEQALTGIDNVIKIETPLGERSRFYIQNTDIERIEEALTHLATLKQQVAATDAEVTSSADLLTAAPLHRALKDVSGKLEHDLHELTPGGMKLGSLCIMNNLRGLRYAVQDTQQALADAATIAEHSAAIWRVVDAVGRMMLADAVEAYNTLPPSVREIAGSMSMTPKSGFLKSAIPEIIAVVDGVRDSGDGGR